MTLVHSPVSIYCGATVHLRTLTESEHWGALLSFKVGLLQNELLRVLNHKQDLCLITFHCDLI